MKIRVNRRRGFGGAKSFVSQFTKKENLSLAGGVLLAPIATGFVTKTLNPPAIGAANVSKAIYSLLIPGLAALLTRRFSPSLATGMVIGGISNAILGFVPQLQASNRFMGEYLDPRRSMGAYIAPRQNVGSMGSSVPAAFNAWAK
jgi:hypothetical protein